ncbi:hypothetical protein [Streptomyces sp. NBC_01089]|uniref:hypothetical protein n=1 Tax=Streptomyces sp. NBC_01089 TaxID=2903747 RepID=UPI00386B6AA4|nr:hypothetical protein OG510_00105 [Streptomyces sp. NBC_01089]WSU46413.1 hypothetical protein OG510_37045 [Streptomyces sp. NBC_01089]
MPASDAARVAAELALTLALYRWVVSPVTGWCAVRLGTGRYPAAALNGAYPEGATRLRKVVAAGSVVAVLSAVVAVCGDTARAGLAWVPTVALALVLWKYLTLDYDAALGLGWQRADRLTVFVAGAAALRWPCLALIAVVLLCGRLGGWTHHSNVCIRMVKAGFCLSLGAGVTHTLGVAPAAPRNTTLAVLLGGVYLSHYVTAAWSKARLGRFPWSWMLDNRTDLLVATSYSWGWARFVPARTVSRVVRRLRPAAALLNSATMLIELAGLLAFAHIWLFVLAVLGAVLFNCVVALTSGLLFWENIVIGVVLAVLSVLVVSHGGDPIHFGVWPWLLSVVLMALVLAGWAWRPNILGWWDTPLSAKILWTVRTDGGETYGLYNDFMSPHDREYARAAGNALIREPVVTFPLGGVEDSDIRDVLVGARPCDEDIEQAKSLFGTKVWDERRAERHINYIRNLLAAVNSGKSKSPLPRAFRWLKAPGGHLYYWGDLPRYRISKGHVSRVEAWYREELYASDQCEWIRLRDELLVAVDIPGTSRN